jgi:hypothetical protein
LLSPLAMVREVPPGRQQTSSTSRASGHKMPSETKPGDSAPSGSCNAQPPERVPQEASVPSRLSIGWPTRELRKKTQQCGISRTVRCGHAPPSPWPAPRNRTDLVRQGCPCGVGTTGTRDADARLRLRPRAFDHSVQSSQKGSAQCLKCRVLTRSRLADSWPLGTIQLSNAALGGVA